MKKFIYFLAVLLAITSPMFSCPFIFKNNSMLHVILQGKNVNLEKQYFINAGEELKIDTNDKVMLVYGQEKLGSLRFQLKYGILQNERQSNNSLPEFKYSELKQLSLSCPVGGKPNYFLVQDLHNSEAKLIEAPQEIVHTIPKLTPCEEGIIQLVQYIKEGKTTLAFLENKVSDFILQAIKQYINDLKY